MILSNDSYRMIGHNIALYLGYFDDQSAPDAIKQTIFSYCQTNKWVNMLPYIPNTRFYLS